MVTTVTGTSDTAVRTKKGLGAGPRPPNGNGSRKDGREGGGGGGPHRGGGRGFSPESYRIAVLVGIASILMMFTALASAYIVRAGLPGSTDWVPVELPRVLFLSTALIVASSVTMTSALRSLKAGGVGAYRNLLTLTLLLGLGFLGAQFYAWRQLVAQGVYWASNPHRAFFYVLTGLHGLHLAGGILGLSILRWRAGRAGLEGAGRKGERVLAGAVGIYWHFMDALWVCLFGLLFFWR
jgi:cytochrome c oxidase subunit 3